MTPLVALEGASVVLGGTLRVLDRVDLAVPRGVVVGLVGESGSGKTTLCRALLGLVDLAEGSIRFDGELLATWLARDPASLRRRAQMLLQDASASLSPRMRIGQALEEPLRIHRLPLEAGRARLAALLRRLGLPPEIVRAYPHQVSGGQARRIGIVRALLLEPELLIADEPTAGLDLSVQGEVLNLLLDLQRELGLTCLLVSHNLNVVRRVTARTVVLYLGQVVEAAPTGALFQRPAHPYAAALLSTNPVLDPAKRGKRIVLQGEIPSVARPPEGCRFHTRCPAAVDRCRSEPPELRPIDAERSVRCHFPFVLATRDAASPVAAGR